MKEETPEQMISKMSYYQWIWLGFAMALIVIGICLVVKVTVENNRIEPEPVWALVGTGSDIKDGEQFKIEWPDGTPADVRHHYYVLLTNEDKRAGHQVTLPPGAKLYRRVR